MNPRRKTLSSLLKDTRIYLNSGWFVDHGLYQKFPKQILSREERERLFEENQKNHKLTRIPGSQFGL